MVGHDYTNIGCLTMLALVVVDHSTVTDIMMWLSNFIYYFGGTCGIANVLELAFKSFAMESHTVLLKVYNSG